MSLQPFHDIHVRNLIDDAILQMDRRGDGQKRGGGRFYIHVEGDISNVQGMGIGRKSSGSASSSGLG